LHTEGLRSLCLCRLLVIICNAPSGVHLCCLGIQQNQSDVLPGVPEQLRIISSRLSTCRLMPISVGKCRSRHFIWRRNPVLPTWPPVIMPPNVTEFSRWAII